MKKTAVEWFSKKLKLLLLEKDIGLDIMSFMKKYDELFKQAKEMEKEQIINACKQCSYSYEEAEQYYNETFKSE